MVPWGVDETLHLVRAVKAQRQTGASQISYVKIWTDNPKHYHTSRNKDQLGNKWRSLEEKNKGHGDTDDCLDRIENDLIRGHKARIHSVISLFHKLKPKMGEVGQFLDDNRIKITPTSIAYRRTFTLWTRTDISNEVFAVNVVHTSMYQDKQGAQVVEPSFCRNDEGAATKNMKVACHVKLVVSEVSKLMVSEELFLCTGTHHSNLAKGVFHTKVDKLIMLSSFSGAADRRIHVIEQGAAEKLQAKAKAEKKSIEHVQFKTLELFQNVFDCTNSESATCRAYNQSPAAMKTKLTQWENYIAEVVQVPKKKKNTVTNYYKTSV